LVAAFPFFVGQTAISIFGIDAQLHRKEIRDLIFGGEFALVEMEGGWGVLRIL